MAFYIFFIILNAIKILSSLPNCINNTNFCIQCNNITNLCEKCQISEILLPDENGGCKGIKKCLKGKNYCKECDLDSELCKKCEENYFSDENGGCSYTSECEISYKGQCLKCKDNFILIGNHKKICKSLLSEEYKNCLEINEINGYCKVCEEGYELQIEQHKCTKLQLYKESLIENTILCIPNYYYNIKENKCLMKELNLIYCKKSKDGIKCDECDEGYYFDENGICIESPFCSESFNFQCIKCIPGYYLSTFNICTITDHCYLVDKNTSLCTTCQLYYYLNKNDHKCYSNLEDTPYKYSKIVYNDKLLRCEHGYYFTNNLKCTDTKYCEISKNGKCLQCSKNNYHLDLYNLCTNIEKCIHSEGESCQECEDGYYFNQIKTECLKAEGKFLNCKYTCDLEEKCCECKNDYYLNITDNLCYDNTKEGNFYKCSYVDYDQKCVTCENFYYVGSYDNKCSKIDNCKISENENKCLECEINFCLDVKGQRCIYNDFIDDINDKMYFYCDRTNKEGTRCEKCKDGYEVNKEGNCVDIDYCEEKKDGKCLKCKDLIINDLFLCSNEMFGCVRTYIEDCLRCDDLDIFFECTKCKEGFRFNRKEYKCEKI